MTEVGDMFDIIVQCFVKTFSFFFLFFFSFSAAGLAKLFLYRHLFYDVEHPRNPGEGGFFSILSPNH